jgi:uncharacterized protein (TIGR00255 family)
MRSMTGYGRGTCEVAGRRLVLEMRSLNHRFFEVKLRLPWGDAAVDQQLTQLLRSRIDRGMVSVTAFDEASRGAGDRGGAPPRVYADLALARGYAQALDEIRLAIGSTEVVTLAMVAAQPGVLVAGEGLPDSDALWRALQPGVEQAVKALCAAREREGEALAADLRARLKIVDQLAGELRELTREGPEHYKKRLEERLARLQPEVDAQRLAVEVAVFADKSDVTEELTRLTTHVRELLRLLDEPGPQGRRLDFLVQELNREVNTIGSKSQSAATAARVVDAKAEIERLREQIQNVE